MMPSLKKSLTATSPLDGIDSVFADLDGVVYAGERAIPFAVENLAAVAKSLRVGYITNNASRADAAVAEQLCHLGLDVAPSDVVTSPQAAIGILAEQISPGGLVLVVGGDGIVTELNRHGYRVTRSAADNPDAVIQGFAPSVDWRQLAEAALALNKANSLSDANSPAQGGTSIPWIATNMDWTIPVAGGIAPGNGTLVSAVHTAVGIFPIVAGKPEKPIFELAAERFGSKNPAMIGDRLDTDILGANRAGLTSIFVMTGVDKAKQLLAASQEQRPDYILQDLRGLQKPYNQPRETAKGAFTVGASRVRVTGRTVLIEKRGSGEFELLRAACAAIWASGQVIHTLDVPPELYTSE